MPDNGGMKINYELHNISYGTFVELRRAVEAILNHHSERGYDGKRPGYAGSCNFWEN